MRALTMPTTPKLIERLLRSPAFAVVARVLVTFPFWESAIQRLLDGKGGVAGMAHYGLHPAWAYNIATLVVQSLGSLMIIFKRWTWLGAGALGVFTALTIPIVHHFWSLKGPAALDAERTAASLVGLIGGLILVSILSARPSGR